MTRAKMRSSTDPPPSCYGRTLSSTSSGGGGTSNSTSPPSSNSTSATVVSTVPTMSSTSLVYDANNYLQLTTEHTDQIGSTGADDSLDCSCRWRSQRNSSNGSMEFFNVSHGDYGLGMLSTLYRSNQMCDVVVRVGTGGLCIPCHRVVLACFSPYFLAMFKSDMLEAKSGQVTLHEMDEGVIQLLIDFCYTGKIVLHESNVSAIMHTACLLQMERVARFCEQFIRDQLDMENAFDARSFAQQYNRRSLLDDIDGFICRNFQQIIDTEAFLNLGVEVLCSVLASNKLNVKDEVSVFSCVMRWVKHQPPTRYDHLPQLLGHVRLSLLPTDYLSVSVYREPLFHTSEPCKDMVLRALAAQLFKVSHFPSTAELLLCLPPLGTPSPRSLPASLHASPVVAHHLPSTSVSSSSATTSTSKHYSKPPAALTDLLPQGAGRNPFSTSSSPSHVTSSTTNNPSASTMSHHPTAANRKSTASTHRPLHTMAADDVSLRRGAGPENLEMFGSLLSRDLYRPRRSYAGVVFCVGGRGHLTDPYRHAEAFDTLDENWVNIQPMQTKRRHVGLVSVNGLIYAVGGHDGSDHLSSGEVYDPASNQWSRIPNMLTRRRGLALAALGECIFCLGGLDDIACFPTVERYNPSTSTWANVASMTTPRGGLGATTYRGNIYVFGGNDSLTSVSSCELYDPVKNQWLAVTSMANRRAGAAAVTLDGHVYVLGGFDDNAPLRTVERYDPRMDSWTTVSPMTSYRGGVGVAALGGRIYAVGGHDGDQYLDTVEVYEPAMDQWLPAPGINLRRAGAGVCFCDIPARSLFRHHMTDAQNLSDSKEDSDTQD